MKTINIAILVILTGLINAASSVSAHAAWTPPLGIPVPPFGLDQVAPAIPSPWSSDTPGFYYIQQAPNCSSTANGYPARPRCTIPDQLFSVIPAGAVVEIHGSYTQGHSRPNHLILNGTQANPIFIRGAAGSIVTGEWEVTGNYGILENLEWQLSVSSSKSSALINGNHLVFRNNKVRGNMVSGQVSMVGQYNLMYQNYVHDGGNLATLKDQDIHCMQVSGPTSYLWIVDNELARCSGDGLQMNPGSDPNMIHHVYIGRNVVHHNKQGGLWTKAARDVVFSQNTLYAHRDPTNWGGGGHGIGWQYEPTNIWIIFNHIYDNLSGIDSGSSNHNNYAQPIYMVGNLIHNIHDPAWQDKGGWSASGIKVVGGNDRYVLGNTIYDVDAGISVTAPAPVHIFNNIISNVTQPQGKHITIDFTNQPWEIQNNLFYQNGAPARLWIDTVHSAPELEAAFPTKAKNLITANPQFVNPAGVDFHLQPGSPAIDQGVDLSPLAAAYQSTFGASIDFAIDCAARPQGSGWDIGAYESGTAGNCDVYVPGPGSGPMPTPVLRLPAYIPVNSQITVEYPKISNLAGFIWGIFQTTEPVANMQTSLEATARTASRSPGGKILTARATSALFGTKSATADLATYQLSTGTYVIGVIAVNTLGEVSLPAIANVTLVNSVSLDGVRVFPNPWRSDRHANHPVTFDNLAPNTHVKIFTVSGHWVKDLPDSSTLTTWDLTTNSGDKAASGLYLYLIKADGGQKKTGQLAIIK